MSPTSHPCPALIASATLLSLTAGCASLVEEAAVPGSSGYSCAGVPDGVVCTPARQMYGLTEDADRINQVDLQARSLATDGSAALAPASAVAAPVAASAAGPRAGVVDAGALVGQPLTPPILVAAPGGGAPSPDGALRIWIAPWRDDAGVLRAPGFLYADLGAAGGRPGDENLLQTPEMIRARDAAARPPSPPAAAPPGPPSPATPPRASPAPPAGPRTFSVSS
jgi:conjugal transfer pilus assembly protein TraV